MKNILILGSTGTIGRNTLEVIRSQKDRFNVVGLACKENKKLLSAQIEEFKPSYIYMEKRDILFEKKFKNVKFFYGEEGIVEISTLKEVDFIIFAIPGIKTLKAFIEAIKEEKRKLEEEKLFGRTTDRNSIILGIINHFNPEVYSQVKELLQDKEGLTKKEELETESGALFWVLADLFLEKQKQEQSILIVTNKQLVDIIQEQFGFPDEERTKYAKRVGKLLKRVGLFKKPDQIKRTKEGMVYCIYLRDFEDLLKRFNYIDILNYITSQSAQTSSDGEVSEFCVVMKLNNTEEPKSETLENSQVSKGKTPVPTDKQVILLKEIIRKLKENGENTIERISEKWNEFSQIYDLTDLEKLLVYLKKEGLIFEPRAGYYELL